MSALIELRDAMRQTSTVALIAHHEWLRSEGLVTVAYGDAGQLVISGNEALQLARQVLAARRRPDAREIVAELRDSALGDAPATPTTNFRNLGSWVESGTPAWRAAFDYSSSNPTDPWFIHLPEDSQRMTLWLIAEILEAEDNDIEVITTAE